ncbi:MAG: DUF1016 family protein [Eggerthellaceae bacterium]|nr:DUF1016 family protein [Eggerthellaceae bacterium]
MTDIERLNSDIEYRNSGDIVEDAKRIIDSAQRTAHQAVNVALVVRNWLLGRRIAEEELGDATRSETYGREIVPMLAKELTQAYGKGYTRTSLYQYVQFYRMFPEIVHLASGQSLPRLSWTHYRELLRVDDPDARRWYEKEAFDQGWAVKTLRRNINTQYYHRLLMTADARKAEVEQEMRENTADYQADKLEFVKNPVIAEFLGFPSDVSVRESELEGAIIANLQQFLLELGKGYAFVARQQHIRTDAGDFFIDLVFYNIILKCYVLIDLKVGQITHQDVGQMDMYVRMYDELKRGEGDSPTLGIVLCSETSRDIARYSVLNGNEQLFASKYKLYLPTEEQLRAEIEAQKEMFRLQHGDDA